MPTTIRERSAASTALTTQADGTIHVTLITPGQGSSGFYSEAVLEAAATDKVWPKGTLMFLDHASETETYERPERSVKEIGAFLTEDAAWDGTALAAPARLVGPYADTIAEMAEVIGVSISAGGDLKEGQITKLYPQVSNSVDFVTYPGRGGSFALLESRRPSRVVESAVRHGVAEATANDTRTALQSALTDRFGGEKKWIWVRDFDETNVWFELETPDGDDTWQLAYSMADTGLAVLDDSDPVEVAIRTQFVPVGSADDGGTTPTESSTGDTMEITEAEHRRLTEAAATAEQRATEAEQREAAATRRSQISEARDTARPIAVEVAAASETLPATAQARVVRESVEALVVTDQGTFDEATFRTAVEAARTAAETEIAEALAAAGVGSVRNGGGGGGGDGVVTREESDAARRKAFGDPVTESKGA